MPLDPPTPGLRNIHYDAVSAAKVAVVVQPGEELHVSEAVADQLTAASGQFKDKTDADPPPAAKKTTKKAAKKTTKKAAKKTAKTKD